MWQDCRGYQPWDNLLSILDEDTEYRLGDILKRHEMNGTNLVYDEVAAGIFEAIEETWMDVKNEVNMAR